MLSLTIPRRELYCEEINEFITIKETKLQLEHSLVSLSKWESKWHKPFLSREPMSIEETIDYIRCMTISQNVDPLIYMNLSKENLEEVRKYIEEPMTATTFNLNNKNKPNREVITAELIYYWMIALNIPFECQKWHLNRLFTLIQVCNIKNTPPKKMSRREIMERNRALNEQRKKELNTLG